MDKVNIINKLIHIRDDLPKKQKVVCDYIIENHEDVSVLSLPELANRIGVGQTTIVRFMKQLGYDSYRDFKKLFHYYTINTSRSTWWHLEKSFTNVDEQTGTLSQSWKETINLLDQTLTNQLLKNFNKAVDLIFQSEMVNILGFRTSKVAADYLGYMLNEFSPNVRELSSDSSFIYDRLLHVGKKDVIILFAISPYTKLSMEVAEFCYEKGIPIILVTDHLSCPASSFATCILNVKSSDKQYSITPVITLIESLVIELGKKSSDHSVKHLNELNQLLKEKDITVS
jgi:DNA-binding MurR/RpiR family transcriptional regulator